MKEFLIDFGNVKACTEYYGSYQEFYNAIISGLEFPGWCGKNPDAIWDLMTGHMEEPCLIYVKNWNTIPKHLDSEKEIMLKVFNRAVEWHSEYNDSVKFIYDD